LRRENAELAEESRCSEDYSAVARESAAKADQFSRAYKDTAAELARTRAQVAYLEEELRTERSRQNDGARVSLR
jgi:hypothetical protein